MLDASALGPCPIGNGIRTCEHHDSNLGPLSFDRFGCADSIEHWHLQIKNHNVRARCGDRLQTFLPVCCLGDFEIEPLVRRKRSRHRQPEERVVVDDQHANRWFLRTSAQRDASLPWRTSQRPKRRV